MKNADNNGYKPNRNFICFISFCVLNLKTERLSPQAHYKAHNMTLEYKIPMNYETVTYMTYKRGLEKSPPDNSNPG